MTPRVNKLSKPGLVVLFGSGELTSVGRSIRVEVFRRAGLTAPVRVGILETPTGFEVNAIHGWPERCQDFFERHLTNYHPIVTRIRAWRRDGENSTNDPDIVDQMRINDFIYCGAGSPSYVIRHLVNTRAWQILLQAHKEGRVLCLGSATAVAAGTKALPVYEIFKAGVDPHWIDGLGLFEQYGLKLAIIPHWNNAEGEDYDSSRCWMGVSRFETLLTQLDPGVTVLGIDETTAVLFDFHAGEFTVMGTGSARIIRNGNKTTLRNENTYPVSILRDST